MTKDKEEKVDHYSEGCGNIFVPITSFILIKAAEIYLERKT
jgi:hypothetical protein